MALKLIDTVLLKRKTGVDDFGQDTYGEEEQISARWNNEVKTVKDEKGLEFISNSTIYYNQTVSLVTGDVLKLNGSDDDFRPVKAIANYRNSGGTKFVNIAYLGKNVR